MKEIFRAVALVFLAISAYGQLASITSLVGNVSDPSGAAVAGAEAMALNEGTQETYTTTTNTDGYYEFPFVKARVLHNHGDAGWF